MMAPRPGEPTFPTELREAFFRWRLPSKGLNVAELFKAVGGLPRASARESAARAVLQGNKTYHAHFEMRSDEKRRVSFDFEIASGAANPELAHVSALFEA